MGLHIFVWLLIIVSFLLDPFVWFFLFHHLIFDLLGIRLSSFFMFSASNQINYSGHGF